MSRSLSQGATPSAGRGWRLPAPELERTVAAGQILSDRTAIAAAAPATGLAIRRRGVEMRLVIEGGRAPASRADLALLRAVARARQWSEDLLAGRARSVEEIAQHEAVSARYVRRLVRLAFLSADIVEAIAAGNQPPQPTAQALTERVDLPLLWTAQAKAVGLV